MTTTDISPRGPFLELRGLRLRLWPILLSPFLMEALLRMGREPARWLWRQGPADWADRAWIFVALAILLQALVGLLAIAAMRRLLPQADAHLRLPERGRGHVGIALLVGLGMALVMFVADYWPNLLSGPVPDSYPVDPINSTGWLFAMAITGLAEETLFRGFLVGALVVLVPGRLRIGSLDLPVAAYIAAAIFGAVHWQSFLHSPLHLALAQQVYAFCWGLIYVWLMERSDSLLAPNIAHGTGNAVEVGMVMTWYGLASS